ncbi:MAG: squalene/phytoene synthase family protein [Candidatus Izemoplasmataceae bacterium]
MPIDETIPTYMDSEPALKEALSKLPDDKQDAVFTVFAFYKTAKAYARDEKDLEKLQAMKKNTKDTFEGAVPKEPLYEALYESVMRFPSDITPFMELLDGLKDDYYQKNTETDADFEAYALKTLGNLNRMLLPILAQKTYKENPKPLRKVSDALAQALTITTVLRNVRDDLRDRRIFLPDKAIEQANVKIEHLRTGIVTPEYRSLVEQYIDRAFEGYETFFDALDMLEKDAIVPVYTALRYYENLLKEIRKNDYNNITKRHSLGPIKKWTLRRKIKSELKKRGLPTA